MTVPCITGVDGMHSWDLSGMGCTLAITMMHAILRWKHLFWMLHPHTMHQSHTSCPMHMLMRPPPHTDRDHSYTPHGAYPVAHAQRRTHSHREADTEAVAQALEYPLHSRTTH